MKVIQLPPVFKDLDFICLCVYEKLEAIIEEDDIDYEDYDMDRVKQAYEEFMTFVKANKLIWIWEDEQ